MIIADEVAHSEEQLQWLKDIFSKACQEISLTIILKVINVMGEAIKQSPTIKIHNYDQEVVHECLDSTVLDNLFWDWGEQMDRTSCLLSLEEPYYEYQNYSL